jgi:hypothetical protein
LGGWSSACLASTIGRFLGEPYGCPPGPLGSLGSRSMVFLLRLLIIWGPHLASRGVPTLLSGRSPGSTPELPHKAGSGSSLQLWVAFAHSDSTHLLSKLFCFLVSSPTRAESQFQVWLL